MTRISVLPVTLIFLVLIGFSQVQSLHLTKSQPLSFSKRSNNNSVSDSEPSSVSSKGNLNSGLPGLGSGLPNPVQQLQTTIQNVIKALNNTLSNLNSNSTSFTNILGSVKNLTSSVINKSRLEEIESLSANVSEFLRISEENSFSGDAEESQILSDEAEGAFRDFHKTVDELRAEVSKKQNRSSSSPRGLLRKRTGVLNNNGAHFHAMTYGQMYSDDLADAPIPPVRKSNKRRANRRQDGFQKIMDKMSDFHSRVDNKVQKSIADARVMIEDTARQGSQFMKNQTTGFMNEIRRMFTSFSDPIRKFFDEVRKGAPTAVITA